MGRRKVNEFLNSEQFAVLQTLLSSDTLAFKTAAKTFEQFAGDELAVVLEIHGCDPVPGEGEVDGYGRAMLSFFVLHLISRGKEKNLGMACPVVAAKATMFKMLQALEILLRDDSKRAEQWRMRANAKDGQAKSKAAGRDAALADAMRFRSVLKAFSFATLLGKLTLDATPIGLLAQEQSDVDGQMDQFAQTHTQELKEAMKDLMLAAEAEPMTTLGTLASKSVRRPGSEVLPTSASPLRPHMCLLPHPSSAFAPLPGEFHTLLTPALSQLLLLDTEPSSKDWSAARDIVVAASSGVVPAGQQSQLLSILAAGATSAQYLGLYPTTFVAIAERNPSLAGQLLPHLPSSSTYVMALLTSPKVDITTMNAVMAQTAPFLKQQLVTKYISAVMRRLESTTDKLAAIKGFSVTLHGLVSKRADALTAADKASVGVILKEYAALPEVKDNWSQLIAIE